MPQNDEPDLIFASKTQTAEQVQKVLESEGEYTEFEGRNLNDQPPAETLVPEVVDPEIGPETSGEEIAGLEEVEEEETAPEAPPAASEPATRPKQSGSARLKAERDKLKLQIAEEKTARTTAQADRDRLAREIEDLRKPKPAETPAPVAAPAVKAAEPEAAEPEPVETEFPDYAEYLKASSRWAVRDETRKQRESTRLAAEQATKDLEVSTGRETITRRQESQRSEAERWDAAVAKARVAHPDWDQVLNAAVAANKVKGPPALVAAVRDRSEQDGTELAYFLVSNPDIENQIADMVALPANASDQQIRMATVKAHYELDRIVKEHLANPAAPAPKAAAAAPPAPLAPPVAPPQAPPAVAPPAKPVPPTPVGSRGKPGYRRLEHMSEQEVADMSVDDYRKRRELGEG